MSSNWQRIALSLGLGFAGFLLVLWPFFESLRSGLNVYNNFRQLSVVLPSYLAAQSNYDASSAQIETASKTLDRTATSLERLQQSVATNPVLQTLLPREQREQLASAAAISRDAITVFDHFNQGDKRVVILLQNTHELRPTGGFVGSFATVFLRNGKLIEHNIEDIYEVDGQIDTYPAAPEPVATYLTEDDRLHLQDANWHPDFAVSGQRILNLMARGGRDEIDTVIAINLDLMERILQISGPVYLPDFDVTVSQENISEVARADRVQFFSGSKAKSDFLNDLSTRLKIKLEALPLAQKREVAELLVAAAKRKEIQLYSRTPVIQEIWSKWGAAGTLTPERDAAWFFPVEANVGVNKVNSAVSREIFTNKYEGLIELTITFINDHSNENYINYQRLLTTSRYQLADAVFSGPDIEETRITDWKVETLETSDRSTLNSYGYLLVIPKNSSRTLTVTFSDTIPTQRSESDRPVHLERQSGTIKP